MINSFGLDQSDLDCFEEGYEANKKGQSINKNPHDRDTDWYDDWNTGWKHSQKQRDDRKRMFGSEF